MTAFLIIFCIGIFAFCLHCAWDIASRATYPNRLPDSMQKRASFIKLVGASVMLANGIGALFVAFILIRNH